MNKNEIIQIQGMEYKEMTKQLLNECALATLIPSKVSLIGIKPNLVAPVPAEFGGTTHPEVVAGIIEYLQENGFTNLQIMEGSWVGDKTEESFEVCGYRMRIWGLGFIRILFWWIISAETLTLRMAVIRLL